MSENLVLRKRELTEIKKKFNWKENNLNGKIKSVTTIKHNLTRQKDNNIYALFEKEYDAFDIRGNIIESSAFDSCGQRIVLLIPSFNSKDYLTNYKYFDDNGELISECFFKYQENGNVLEHWDNGTTSIEYHLQKNEIEHLNFDIDNNLIWKEIYKYDTKGNLIEFCNDLGKTIYIVNTLGDTLEEIKYDSENNISEKKKFKYKIDKHKNWVKKKEFIIKNNIEIPKAIFEREITYY
ncbi:hypothetical protein MHL31_12990 [Lutibacter sp. A80]|uniref:hypothetical protein n=1 Tax=Lutibacter sp. A80 TaxID=2918453 RepID=UPI001F0517EB|nr:hypothetical protein [Lutibacter sp. A80]UMB59986.1 hypothetical protein MHL31_12990 [Lutibacter sp. A80]